MGPVGVQEMIFIFLLALVLFGPKKLPELARTVGKALSEFRRAQNELKATLQHHMNELERESDSVREVTRSFSSGGYNNYYDSYNYDSRTYGTETQESIAPPASQPAITGASAIQGAEVNPAAEPQPNEGYQTANGTVPRVAPATAELNGHDAAHEAPAPAEDPVNG